MSDQPNTDVAAAEPATDSAAPEEAPETQPAETTDDQLGDAGKKALTEERTARKAADTKVKELEAEVSRLRRSNAATKGTDLDAIREEMRTEFATQMLATELRAEAKGRLKDPADVARYSEYTADLKAGDAEAIKAAVDKLLTEKPYLAAEPAGPKPWGDVGGGQSKSAEPEPKSAMDRMRRAYDK